MTSFELGRRYERQVLKSLLEELAELHAKGETNVFARGLAVAHPYEVDISLTVDNGGFPLQVRRIWVECRWRQDGTIKGDDVSHVVYKAQDSVRYAREIDVWHQDGLMFVSNRPFHADGINVAKHESVACRVFDGRRLIQDIDIPDWISGPRWLRRC